MSGHARDLCIDRDADFHEGIYREKYPDVAQAIDRGEFRSGLHHWLIAGQQEGRDCHPWKVDAYYRILWDELDFAFLASTRPLAEPATKAALFHDYIETAGQFKLNPNALFDEAAYQTHFPDVAQAVAAGAYVSGFHHWVSAGRSEGRRIAIAQNKLVEQVALHHHMVAHVERSRWLKFFDPDFYVAYLQRAHGANINPSIAIDIFLKEGVFRGDIPTSQFDEEYYISYNDDVARARQAGLIPSGYVHFIAVGEQEGRRPRHDLAKCLEQKMGTLAEAVYLQNVDALEAKIAAPRIEVIDTPGRLNVFVPSLDPDIMFGGYISLLHFLSRVVEAGWDVAFYICEDGQSNKTWFLRGLRKKPRWLAAFQNCSVQNISFADQPILVGRHDLCLAYSAWTAYIASSIATQLETKQFIFFVQEYETIFHENNALQFLVEAAYGLDHVALFNTSLLQEFFQTRRVGVFSERGSGKYLTYQHALADNRPDIEHLKAKTTRTLLFYSRPERHAGRNLFEIGVMALRRAVQQGVFDKDWRIIGLGSLGNDTDLDLGSGAVLSLRSRLPQHEYEALLQGVDVGLSLMWAPHPSILPFELAKSGAVCVTNEYSNRPASLLARFGRNIVAAEPSIDGIVAGLREAVRRANDIEQRVAEAAFDWPVNWDLVFTTDFIRAALALPDLARSGTAAVTDE